jgi:hypothetical protein
MYEEALVVYTRALGVDDTNNAGDNQGLEDGEREVARGKEACERFYPFLVACKGRPPEVVWNRFSCRWF